MFIISCIGDGWKDELWECATLEEAEEKFEDESDALRIENEEDPFDFFCAIIMEEIVETKRFAVNPDPQPEG